MVILIIQLNTGNMKLKTTYLLLLAIVPMSVYAEEEPETFMTDSVHVNGGGISAMSFVTGTSDISMIHLNLMSQKRCTAVFPVLQ